MPSILKKRLSVNTNDATRNELKNRTIMHIDYDSFFASVEQQANPFLRGIPIGVTGSSLTKGVVCAASKEAKKCGVKTAMPMFKAKQICPQIIGVKGDHTKYSYVSKRSLEIFKKYTDLVEPFSIDESFIDVTKTVKFFDNPINLAKQIKKDIENEFGKYITCSVGISNNKLLAKAVTDLKKPNGIYQVAQTNLAETLKILKLSDFCGIGPRIEKRLNNLNIYTIQDLQNTPEEILYKEFGNIESQFLKNLSFGMDYSKVSAATTKRRPKSLSHQHTLSKNTKSLEIIKINLRRLAEMVAGRLRNQNMYGKTISLYLRDSNRKGYGQRTTINPCTNEGLIIFKAAEKMLTDINWNKETRLIGIGISNLVYEHEFPLYLLNEQKKSESRTKALDLINNKFGDFTLVPADTLRADRTKGKISSFLRHK